ncbi:MAG: hypothetical protein GY940_34980 [bacterium]|nr:hypothetical protein [bacterium]
MSDTNEIRQEQDKTSPQIQAFTPSLPSGGGAVKGIGETFQADAFSGTGSYSVPIYTTPSRGFEPAIGLTYNSGSGNSAAGIGFSIPTDNFSVRTEKGIPRYEGNDVYLYSGGGILTPKLKKVDNRWEKDCSTQPGTGNSSWNVCIWLPREEKTFDKIELWICKEPGKHHHALCPNG